MREFLFSLLVIPLFAPGMVIFLFWERLDRRLRPLLVGMAMLLVAVIFAMVLVYAGGLTGEKK